MGTDERNRRATGAAIRALRALQDMSQPALAERAGLSVYVLRRIEYGEHDDPEAHLLAICNALGVQLAHFRTIRDIYIEAIPWVERAGRARAGQSGRGRRR